jgi:hypothetical protein
VIFKSKSLPEFWIHYNDLPDEIQRRADKQFALLTDNPKHRSLQLKPVGAFWSARVTDNYRALAILEKTSLHGSGSGCTTSKCGFSRGDGRGLFSGPQLPESLIDTVLRIGSNASFRLAKESPEEFARGSYRRPGIRGRRKRSCKPRMQGLPLRFPRSMVMMPE